MHVYSNKDVASWAPILAKNGTEDQSSASSRPWKTYKLQWKTEVDDIPRAYLYYETPLRKGITTFRIYTITGLWQMIICLYNSNDNELIPR